MTEPAKRFADQGEGRGLRRRGQARVIGIFAPLTGAVTDEVDHFSCNTLCVR